MIRLVELFVIALEIHGAKIIIDLPKKLRL